MALQVPPHLRDVSPNQGTTSAKRTTSSSEDDRNVRSRPDEDEEQQPGNSNDGELTTTPDGNVPQEGIRNHLFATFKNLRKLNVKLTNAAHHMKFLIDLRDRNQVPKGLKVKSTVTTADLPPDLYEEWEQAHVELSNQLRDIMIRYWQLNLDKLNTDINKAYEKLLDNASEQEINTIDDLISKATSSKEEDLKQRRKGKQRRGRGATAASEDTNQQTS